MSALGKWGLGLFLSGAALAGPALLPDGQDGLRDSFRVLAEPLRDSVVVIRAHDTDGDHQVLGCVVRSDGLLLTKASEVGLAPFAEWSDGRRLEAQVLAIDSDWDLALLSVEANDLVPVDWSSGGEPSPAVGRWVLSIGSGGEVLRAGIVGAEARPIPTLSPGFLGVFPGNHERGAQLLQIVPGSSAEQAGFQLDDIIHSINGEQVHGAVELVRLLSGMDPGDDIEIVYERDGEEHLALVELGERPADEAQAGSFHVADLVRVNHRRDRFPAAFRHDAVVSARAVGGPLLAADGDLLGFNLARLDRAGMLAISAPEAKMVVESLLDEAGL